MTTQVISSTGQQNYQFSTYDVLNSYLAGDVVIKDGNVYQANGDVPSGTAFAIGTTGATWTLVVQGGATLSTLSNGNSSVSIPTANGNVVVNSAGNTVLTVTGTGANVAGTANVTGNLAVGSNVTVTGNVTATNFFGVLANGTSNVSVPASSGNINLSAAGNANVAVVTGTGVNVAGTLNATGNANVGNIGAASGVLTGTLSVTGNATVGNLIGAHANGNSNVNIPLANGNVTISAVGTANVVVVTGTGANITGTLNTTGNANVGNIGATGVVATTLSGSLTTAAQPNVTSVGTLTGLTVSGVSNLSAVGNVKITGGSNGQYLQTDGAGNLSFVTVSTTSITNGNSNVSIPSANGNVNISASGNANILAVTGTGVNVAGTLNATGNITGGNFVGRLANGTSNVSIPTANGNVLIGAAGNANIVVVTGVGANINGTLNATGAITAQSYNGDGGNLSNVAKISNGTSNVSIAGSGTPVLINSGGNLIANFHATLNGGLNPQGVEISGILTAGSATVGTITANTANLGPVANLTVTGGTNGQYLQTNGSGALTWATISTSSVSNGNSNVSIPSANGNVNISATGNANVLIVTGAGVNVAGTLNATGNVVGGNLTTGGALSVTGNANVGNLGTAGLITATGNVTGGNLVTGGLVNATGNLQGAGLTVNNPTGGTIANITGQANIVYGTQTWRFVTKPVADGGPGSYISFPDTSVQYTAYPGNATTLSLTGNITGGNLISNGALSVTGTSNLGAVGNVTITGGSSGQYLQTDGSGVLSWVSPSSGSNLINGTSNIVVAASGNVTTSVAGNANILTVTGTGVNVAGTLNSTGNANVGNIGATGAILTGNANVAGNVNMNNNGYVNFAGGTGYLTTYIGANTLALNGVTVTNSLSTGVGILVNGLTAMTANSAGINVTAGIIGNTLTVNGVSNLSAIGNVKITGGTNGQYLTTDGNGNLSFTTVSAGAAITNGNSNVSIPSANGNVTISAVGTSNVVVITATGANVAGTLTATGNVSGGNLTTSGAINVTGNATVGNLGTSGLIIATGNITGGNLVTGGVLSVTGNANVGNIGATSGVLTGTLSVTGNANVGNLGTSGLVVATGNVTGGNLVTGGVLSVTGNANVGNLGTAGLIVATGNVTGGNLTTGGVLSATGNVTGGNLTTGGVLSVTGNANVGNIGATTAIFTTSNITTINSGLMQNGNSNVTIAANGIVSIVSQGGARIIATLAGANVNGTLGITGNTTSGNFIGPLANGNSNINISGNANVNVSSNGVANILVVASNGASTGANARINGTTISVGPFGTSGNGFNALLTGPNTSNVLPYTTLQVTSNANIYAQMNMQNFSTGTQATSEYVATADNGTDTTYFVDMGIAGSAYSNSSPNNSLGTSLYPRDSYLYAQGDSGNTSANGGNLVIGTTTSNKVVKFISGGVNSGNIVMTLNAPGTSNTVQIAGSLYLSANADSTALAVGPGARSNCAIAMFPGAGNLGDYAFREYATVNTTMYFDLGMGANAAATGSSSFKFRNSNVYNEWGVVNQYGFVTSVKPAFRVYGASTSNISVSTNTDGTLKSTQMTVDYNQGSYYDGTTGRFTAPVTGLYQINLVGRNAGFTSGISQLAVIKNNINSGVACMIEWAANSTMNHVGSSTVYKLTAGDYLTVKCLAGQVQFDNNDNWSVAFLG